MADEDRPEPPDAVPDPEPETGSDLGGEALPDDPAPTDPAGFSPISVPVYLPSPPAAAAERRRHRDWSPVLIAVCAVLIFGIGLIATMPARSGSPSRPMTETDPTASGSLTPSPTARPTATVTITRAAPVPQAPQAPQAPVPQGPASSAPPIAPAPSSDNSGIAAQTVEQYYNDINARDYADAWTLGGQNLEGGSYADYVAGFSTTSQDQLAIAGVDGGKVYIALQALQTDGTTRAFQGWYLVSDGVITQGSVQRTG